MNPTQNSLPDLRKLNQRLALNGVRVQAFLDGLTPRLDQLLLAISEENMAEVGRTSHFIYRCCDVYGYDDLAQKAGEVCQSAAACESVEVVRRKVVRLIGAFGRTSEEAQATMAT